MRKCKRRGILRSICLFLLAAVLVALPAAGCGSGTGSGKEEGVYTFH